MWKSSLKNFILKMSKNHIENKRLEWAISTEGMRTRIAHWLILVYTYICSIQIYKTVYKYIYA